MSRCFPFPPPGYEKKARTDDVDFLKKEKQKEKHKKEKKDKEKRENNEKKKDRSDGKHKDKKDKKEKHRDKKDKDRDKEKDSSNSEKKFPGHPERQNGEKTADKKKLKSEGQSGKKRIPKENCRDKDQSSFSSEKKLGGQFSGNNGEKVSQNSSLAEEFGDAKFVQELGRRVTDESARAGNRLVEKFMGSEPKRDDGMVRLVAKTAAAFNEEEENNKRSDDRKSDVQGIRDERRPGRNAMVQNIAGAVNTRVERVPRQVESNTERRDEWKEKTKEKGSDIKIRDKRMDMDREKKGHGKDKDRDKEEKKKEEKAKARGEHRNLESDNLKRSNKDVPVGTNNLKALDSSNEGNKCGAIEENHGKRKDCEKIGFFHVNDVKPSKLLNTTSPLSTDNGRTLKPCEALIPHASDSHRAGNGLLVDAKEKMLNGTNVAQLSYISPTKHSSATVSPTKHLSASARASHIDAVSTRPPHPDSKYLRQVLSVPEMEECPDFDEHSWLFHSIEYQSKKPKVGFSNIDEVPQVWAEALQIESADVCALPYVIPY